MSKFFIFEQVKSHSSKDNAIPNPVRYGAHAWKLNNNGIYQRALKIKTWSQFQHSLQPMKAFGSLNIKFMCIDIMLCPGYILPLSSLSCSMGFLFMIICTISISLSGNCSMYFFPMQKKVNVMKLLMQDPQTSLCITLYSLHIAQCQVYFHWYNIHQFSNLTSVDTMIWKTFMKEHVLHTWIQTYKHEYRTYISWYGYGWYASLIIFLRPTIGISTSHRT